MTSGSDLMADFEFGPRNVMLMIIGLVLLIFIIWMGSTYNKFVQMEEDIDGNWNEIMNQEERKFDLIPQLVNQSEQYQEFEKSTLENITALRTQWMSAGSDEERLEVSDEMGSLIDDIIITYEAYPYLQAEGPLRAVMDEMAGTENRIAYRRTKYIEAVKDYNAGIKKFPGVLVANMFGFEERENLYGSSPGS